VFYDKSNTNNVQSDRNWNNSKMHQNNALKLKWW